MVGAAKMTGNIIAVITSRKSPIVQQQPNIGYTPLAPGGHVSLQSGVVDFVVRVERLGVWLSTPLAEAPIIELDQIP